MKRGINIQERRAWRWPLEGSPGRRHSSAFAQEASLMTGGQSVIQPDKLPVAGMNRISPARLFRLLVRGRRHHPESLQMSCPWTRPPVITPDNGSSLPDVGHCHWAAVHVFYMMWCGSPRKKEGCFYVKFKKMGSWASLLPFPFFVSISIPAQSRVSTLH